MSRPITTGSGPRAAPRSMLDDIPGIGPARRKALLSHFGSIRNIEAASPDDLSTAPGMTRAAAEAVFQFFHPEANGQPVSSPENS